MYKSLRNTCVATACLLAMSLPQTGTAGPARMESVRESIGPYTAQLNAAEEVLRSKDQADWTQQEIENYLQMALFVVYDDVLLYVDTHEQTPASSRVLMNQKLIEKWPGNPFNDWKPLSWGSKEFSPGDLVFQECPPELYSGLWNPRPRTFKLSINGPSAEYVPLSPVTYGLDDWASLPAGTAFMTGAGSSPYTETRRQYEESRQAAQSDEENASDQ